MKKFFVSLFLTCFALSLFGCAAGGRLAQTVGGKFTSFSENRSPGFVKDTTGLVGDVYTAAGQTAIDIAKENEEQERLVARDQTKPPKLKSKPVLVKQEGAK